MSAAPWTAVNVGLFTIARLLSVCTDGNTRAGA